MIRVLIYQENRNPKYVYTKQQSCKICEKTDKVERRICDLLKLSLYLILIICL
jgi:hypothetical protein